MKWLTNIGMDAELPDYLRNAVVGEPKASATLTVEQLKAQGIIGLYKAPFSLTIVLKEEKV